MIEQEKETKSFGFEMGTSAVYLAALLISYFLINSLFENNTNHEALVSCLVMVVPCTLDGFRDFFGSLITHNKPLDILNLSISCLLFIMSCLMAAIICGAWNNVILESILIYGSTLCFVKHAVNMIYNIICAGKVKFSKEVKNG